MHGASHLNYFRPNLHHHDYFSTLVYEDDKLVGAFSMPLSRLRHRYLHYPSHFDRRKVLGLAKFHHPVSRLHCQSLLLIVCVTIAAGPARFYNQVVPLSRCGAPDYQGVWIYCVVFARIRSIQSRLFCHSIQRIQLSATNGELCYVVGVLFR